MKQKYNSKKQQKSPQQSSNDSRQRSRDRNAKIKPKRWQQNKQKVNRRKQFQQNGYIIEGWATDEMLDVAQRSKRNQLRNAQTRQIESICTSKASKNDYQRNKQQTQDRIKHFKRSNVTSRGRINNSVLSSIIIDQKKMNRKLDQQEVDRAASKFKDLFTQQIKPVTLSEYLSNYELQKKSYLSQKQEIICKQAIVQKPNLCDQDTSIKEFKDLDSLKTHTQIKHQK